MLPPINEVLTCVHKNKVLECFFVVIIKNKKKTHNTEKGKRSQHNTEVKQNNIGLGELYGNMFL